MTVNELKDEYVGRWVITSSLSFSNVLISGIGSRNSPANLPDPKTWN